MGLPTARPINWRPRTEVRQASGGPRFRMTETRYGQNRKRGPEAIKQRHWKAGLGQGNSVSWGQTGLTCRQKTCFPATKWELDGIGPGRRVFSGTPKAVGTRGQNRTRTLNWGTPSKKARTPIGCFHDGGGNLRPCGGWGPDLRADFRKGGFHEEHGTPARQRPFARGRG